MPPLCRAIVALEENIEYLCNALRLVSRRTPCLRQEPSLPVAKSILIHLANQKTAIPYIINQLACLMRAVLFPFGGQINLGKSILQCKLCSFCALVGCCECAFQCRLSLYGRLCMHSCLIMVPLMAHGARGSLSSPNQAPGAVVAGNKGPSQSKCVAQA